MLVIFLNYKKHYNTKIKIYPDGNYKLTCCNQSIFTETIVVDDVPGFDFSIDSDSENLENLEFENQSAVDTVEIDTSKPKLKNKCINYERSVTRARGKIFDIIYLNSFKYFVTITFNPKQVDSTNVNIVMRKLVVWLNHQQQRLGMEYILVPEYHVHSTDGVTDRIHCHMLISDYPQRLLTHAVVHTGGGSIVYNNDGSPKLLYNDNGQPVYNMLGWRYGFSTCIPVYGCTHSNLRLAHYVSKYVTKDVHQIFGKYYWSSHGLKRDVDTYYFDSDYYSLPFHEYQIPNTKIFLKYDSYFDFSAGK